MESELKAHLEGAEPWAKLPTSIPGVFVVKVPGKKNGSARLMVEVNPVDKSGKPKKYKGLFIADFEMYLQFCETLQDDKIGKLIKKVDGINPAASKKEEKVLDLD